MHFNLRALLSASLAASSAFASPTPPAKDLLIARDDNTSPITNLDQLTSAITSFRASGNTTEASAAAIYSRIQPQSSPASIADAVEGVRKITEANPGDLFRSGAEILLGGFAGGNYASLLAAYAFTGSSSNLNPRPAFPPVFPRADPRDAPYSLSEAQLRGAIFIPPSFTYGRKQPLLFLPGTGARSGPSFAGNMGKLFTNNPLADPVYVNVPRDALIDIQVAAEYVAYATNYISAISGGRNVSTLSWSQGSISGQWALKYWPSTRGKTSDKISISPDYDGTVLARLLCPGFTTPFCTPAIAQQNFNSTFIRTLASRGGDTAYVPTTNIYSIFDEIVQPQTDPIASGFLTGATNVQLQSVCTPVLPGGAFYNEHVAVLFNSLAFRLAEDALANPGPAQLARVDVTEACSEFAARGITLPDVLATYANLPIAAVAIARFTPKSEGEPPIMPYAQGDVPA